LFYEQNILIGFVSENAVKAQSEINICVSPK